MPDLPREFLEKFTEEDTFGPRIENQAGIFQVDKCGKSIPSRGSSTYRACSEKYT